MQRQRAHLVGSHLTSLWLQARRDVGKQRAVLALNAADLELEARRIRLTAVRRQQKVTLLRTETHLQLITLAMRVARRADSQLPIFQTIRNLLKLCRLVCVLLPGHMRCS